MYKVGDALPRPDEAAADMAPCAVIGPAGGPRAGRDEVGGQGLFEGDEPVHDGDHFGSLRLTRSASTRRMRLMSSLSRITSNRTKSSLFTLAAPFAGGG